MLKPTPEQLAQAHKDYLDSLRRAAEVGTPEMKAYVAATLAGAETPPPPVAGHPAAGNGRSVLAAVNSCPDRGSVLPVSEQPECGCAELTECRAGKGADPGKVTLRQCIDCRTQAVGTPGET